MKIAKNNHLALTHVLALLKAFLLRKMEGILSLPEPQFVLDEVLFEMACKVVIGSTIRHPRVETVESRHREEVFIGLSTFFNTMYQPRLQVGDEVEDVGLTYMLTYWVKDINTMYCNNIKANLKMYFTKYVCHMLAVQERAGLVRAASSGRHPRSLDERWSAILIALDAPGLSGPEEDEPATTDALLEAAPGAGLEATEAPRAEPEGEPLTEEEQQYVQQSTMPRPAKLMVARIRREAQRLAAFMMGDPAAPIPATLQPFEWLITSMRARLPARAAEHPEVAYNVKVRPLAYFPAMLWMVDQLERLCAGVKLPNLFPLKRSFIVDHCQFDTTAVLKLLCSAETRNRYNRHIREEGVKDAIWGEVFRIDRRAFKASFAKFRYIMKTDGLSMSIIFTLDDDKPPRAIKADTYVQDLSAEDLQRYAGMKLVSFDPGKGNLFFAVDGDGLAAHVMRYTAQFRRVDGKHKKYGKKRLKIKKEERIGGVTMESIESSLTRYNAKTLKLADFLDFVGEKSRVRNKLLEVYSRLCWRNFRFAQHLAIRKHEEAVLDHFELLFGPPDRVVVTAGDYSRRTTHMRGRRPVPCIGTRRMFRRRGYATLLVDEFRTSKCCSNCGCVNEQFLSIPHPRYHNVDDIMSWSILRCTSCGMIWNRDRNAANNIWRISRCEFDRVERPAHLRRPEPAEPAATNDPSAYALRN